MTQALRHQLLLLFTCGLVFFVNLGASRLFDEDEPKNAECGREMFERGDWLVPTYNYDLRTDKPIMLYWLMLSSFQLLGVSEFSARLPSAFMAMLTVFSVYAIGRRLFDKRVGFWAAIMLASSLMYVTIGRISTPDSTLIGFITVSLMVYVYSVPRSVWTTPKPNRQARLLGSTKHSSQPVPEFFSASSNHTNWPGEYLPARWGMFALMYAIMGLAVLTKGPVGFLLPCAVIGLFVMCLGASPQMPGNLSWRKPVSSLSDLALFAASFFAPSRFLPSLWAMRPFTLMLVVSAVALPWYISVGIATDGAWLEGFLGGHNIGRFSSAMEGHSGPIFYYVIAILMGFFPWSVFLPVALYYAIFKRNLFKQEHRPFTFLLCWIGLYFVFFSVAQTKLPNYILPCYPPLALLTAWLLVRWQEESIDLPEWAFKWSSRSLIGAGLALLIALPIASWILLPGYLLLGAIGVIPIALGGWMLYAKNHTSRRTCLNGLGAGAVLLVVVAFSGIAPWLSHAQESFRLADQAREISSEQTPLATYDYFAPNLPFYARREVIRYHSPEEIADYFHKHPEGMLCVREDHWGQLTKVLPENLHIVGRTQRFFRTHDVLLLRGKSSVTQSAALPDKKTRIK